MHKQAAALRMLEEERVELRSQLNISRGILGRIEAQAAREPVTSCDTLQCLILVRQLVEQDEHRCGLVDARISEAIRLGEPCWN